MNSDQLYFDDELENLFDFFSLFIDDVNIKMKSLHRTIYDPMNILLIIPSP